MIYAYHRPCGASKLAKRLRLSIHYRDGETIRRRLNPMPHINWGWRSQAPGVTEGYLNADPRIAVSKVETFKKLSAANLPIPRWALTRLDLAAVIGENRSIIARRDGLSGGRDMFLLPKEGEYQVPFRPDFFVERLSHYREFRVHVFCGEVIHRQAKFIPHGFEGIARNWENGCYFTSEGLDRWVNEGQLRDLEELAKRSVEVLGLDFGAVDLLMNKHLKPYVLEVNTAPGLRSDATYAAYEGALRKLYEITER